ncbi:hypothetical protein EV426DRAFT_615754 [Tirmania nivea]|nr:hypothetical protein EV426DRAFT_615754 [Tirmania nivea]
MKLESLATGAPIFSVYACIISLLLLTSGWCIFRDWRQHELPTLWTTACCVNCPTQIRLKETQYQSTMRRGCSGNL